MGSQLHLFTRHRRILEALVLKHLPGVEVWAYGSRINGRSHDGSDLDLILRGPGLEKIPADQLFDFADAVAGIEHSLYRGGPRLGAGSRAGFTRKSSGST